MIARPLDKNKKQSLIQFAVFLIAAIFVMILSGCGTKAAATPDPEASVATSVEVQAPLPTPAYTILEFGQVHSYVDGLSLSISAPAEFQPSAYSAGVVDGATNLVFTFVLTNNSNEVIEPSSYTTASSGGIEASIIFDVGSDIGEIGMTPTTPLLPGQTVQWLEAWSVADPAGVTLSAHPTWKHDQVLFTNLQK